MTPDERERVQASMWAAYRESSAPMQSVIAPPALDEVLPVPTPAQRHERPDQPPRNRWLVAAAAAVALLTLTTAAVMAVSGTNQTTPSAPTELVALPISDDGEFRRWRLPLEGVNLEFETTSNAIVTDLTSVSFAIVLERPDPTSTPRGGRVEVSLTAAIFDDQAPQAWFEQNGVDARELSPDLDARTTAGWRIFIPAETANTLGCAAFEPCLAATTAPGGVAGAVLRSTLVNDLRIVEDADTGTSLSVLAGGFSYIVGSSAILAEADQDRLLSTIEISPR